MCVRSFEHKYNKVNSYFDFPKLIPSHSDKCDSNILLLDCII